MPTDDFVLGIIQEKFKDATGAQQFEAAELARATARADGGGIAGLMVIHKDAAMSIIDRAMAQTMAKAKSAGTSDFTPSDLEYIRDVRATYTKLALETGKPGVLRKKFIEKYGLEKHREAMKLTGATDDLRVAGKNPWKGNKVVKRALKAAALEPTAFNVAMHPDQIKQPKPKLTPEETALVNPFDRATFNLTAQGRLVRDNYPLAQKLAQRAGAKLP